MRKQRVPVVFVVLMLGFGAILARLVKLQVLEGPLWLAESERSTVSFTTIASERGWIFDRNGEPLARHRAVRDLQFRYRSWRRQTVAGQASHAWWTLGLPRAAVPAALGAAEELTRALGDVTVGEIAALEPRQRRRDLGYYLEHLLGEELWEAVVAHLRDGDGFQRTLAALPGYAAGEARALARAAREREALQSLAAMAGRQLDELLLTMEDAALRAAGRVEAGLAEEQLDERNEYKKLQRLHGEFDDDPVTLAGGISYDLSTLVAIRGDELGGMEVVTTQRREYPPETADVAPLLVGTVGTPSPQDMAEADARRRRLSDLSTLTDLTREELDELELLRLQVRESDYAYGEERGRLGIEAALEQVLRGKRGWVTSREGSDQVRRVQRREPVAGLNVVLTLDVDLQRACQEVLDAIWQQPPEVVTSSGEVPADVPAHWSGAIVLLDPRDGQVLALATGPRASRRDLEERYGELVRDDPHQRLKHRAIDAGGRAGNLPPPGSTFKPVSALAGLEGGVGITPGTRLLCEGGLAVGDRVMGCLGHHGEIALRDALARSCNVYFYRLGRQVGAEALADMASRFGFGREDGGGLLRGNETLAAMGVPVGAGVVEARSSLGQGPWNSTAAMRLAIGQAPLDDVTPLQVASMLGAVGTGVLRPPTLVKDIEGYPPIPVGPGGELGIAPAHLQAVRDGLAAVVDDPHGTAHALDRFLAERLPWLRGGISGKTGTAEVDGGRTHAWFAGFLPRQAPRLAFAVLVEDCALHGGEAARPVFEWLLAKPAMEDFLRRQVFGLPPRDLPR